MKAYPVQEQAASHEIDMISSRMGTMGVIAGVVGALQLALGIGLLRLQKWARFLMLVGNILGLVCAPVAIYMSRNQFNPLNFFWGIIGVVLNGFLIWYFLQSSVKAQFETTHAG